MKVFTSVKSVGQELLGGALAIGNFDGIHLGHQALFAKLGQVGKNLPKAVLTFSPHPMVLLNKQKAYFSICSDKQRLAMFASLGIDVAIIHSLTKSFLKLSAKDFIESVLIAELKVSQVVVGDDFRFGLAASGDVNMLKKYTQNFTTHVVNPVMQNSVRCSSTLIKKYLQEGEITKANQMLGHSFSLLGEVLHGQKKGGILGFKTANIDPGSKFPLSRGVFATRVKLAKSGKNYIGCTNVGVRPSISDENKLVVETHILDLDEDLYGQEIEVFFIKRLRDEQKFTSTKSLVQQVHIDLEKVRQIFAHAG